MHTMDEARQKVEAMLTERGKHLDGGLAVLDGLTMVKPYGWIFFYDSQRHIETGDVADAIAGGGPVVVLAATGEIHELGSRLAPELEVRGFEERLGLRSG
jgi:hypothetical protein